MPQSVHGARNCCAHKLPSTMHYPCEKLRKEWSDFNRQKIYLMIWVPNYSEKLQTDTQTQVILYASSVTGVNLQQLNCTCNALTITSQIYLLAVTKTATVIQTLTCISIVSRSLRAV